MDREQEKRLKEFKEFFSDKLKSIEDISCENKSDSFLFKKIIYFSFLESLAKAAYPNDSVKRRFIKFLDKFTNWNKNNDYCVIHMATEKKFTKETLNFCEQEVDKVFHDYEGIGSFNIVKLNSLPEKYIQKEKSKENGDLLNSFTYATILYKSRNRLVHQFQSSVESGMKFETMYHDESPFFQLYTELGYDEEKDIIKGKSKSIEIIFPNSFLKKLATEGLEKFIVHCEENNFNPFTKYYAKRKIHEKIL